MEKNFDIWNKSQNAAKSLKSTAKHTFGEYVNEIVLVLCLIFTVAIPLVSVKFTNPFSADFIANTVYMTISTYVCYLVFIPGGKKDELQRSDNAETTEWKRLCEQIKRNSLIGTFCEYCHKEEAREAEERIKNILSVECIDYGTYLKLYSGMKKSELRKELKQKKITREKYLILRQARRVKQCEIMPSLILSKSEALHINDAGRKAISFEKKAAISRPFIIMLSSVSLACAVLMPTQSFGIGVAVTIICRIFGICMASFAGYNVGVNQIRWEKNRTENKILFIEKFFEDTGINETV